MPEIGGSAKTATCPLGGPPQGALNRLALGSRITTSKVTRFAPDPHSDDEKCAPIDATSGRQAGLCGWCPFGGDLTDASFGSRLT